jgi:hypothetical protein
MVRDTQDGKVEWHRIFEGPMARRLAIHLTKGAKKYPDNENGTANWTKANSATEWRRFKQSAARHFAQWLYDERDEDHGAAVMFNINGAENTRDKITTSPPSGDELWAAIQLLADNLYESGVEIGEMIEARRAEKA